MIPKKIHYCWFGSAEKPATFQKCLDSWKQWCPEYVIKEWNEKNAYDIGNSFYHNALRKNYYAFAADYIRVKVLHDEGGVYLDTDMFLLRSPEALRSHSFVIGEEVAGRVNFAFFAAQSGHPLLKKMLDYYENHYFNPYSLPVITHLFNPLLQEHRNTFDITILPPKYFYSFPYEQRKNDFKSFLSADSYAVHLWDHSWKTEHRVTFMRLLYRLYSVSMDYLFYGYPYNYFKRYFREFARKAYHQLIGK